MKKLRLLSALIALALWGICGGRAWSEDEKDAAALSKALQQTKPAVSLERGIHASKQKGTPISAKYELEDGKLQLSVYTRLKNNKFSEVIVDYTKGTVMHVEDIDKGDDLKEATEQNQVMSKAKKSLESAVSEAKLHNHGFTAVSAMPVVHQGHAAAEVTLMKGSTVKKVMVHL